MKLSIIVLNNIIVTFWRNSEKISVLVEITIDSRNVECSSPIILYKKSMQTNIEMA